MQRYVVIIEVPDQTPNTIGNVVTDDDDIDYVCNIVNQTLRSKNDLVEVSVRPLSEIFAC